MDAWSQEQLKKMQSGGNDKLNAFLKQYGIDKETDIKEKYSSQAAEVGFSPQRSHKQSVWMCMHHKCNHMVQQGIQCWHMEPLLQSKSVLPHSTA